MGRRGTFCPPAELSATDCVSPAATCVITASLLLAYGTTVDPSSSIRSAVLPLGPYSLGTNPNTLHGMYPLFPPSSSLVLHPRLPSSLHPHECTEPSFISASEWSPPHAIMSILEPRSPTSMRGTRLSVTASPHPSWPQSPSPQTTTSP